MQGLHYVAFSYDLFSLDVYHQKANGSCMHVFYATMYSFVKEIRHEVARRLLGVAERLLLVVAHHCHEKQLIYRHWGSTHIQEEGIDANDNALLHVSQPQQQSYHYTLTCSNQSAGRRYESNEWKCESGRKEWLWEGGLPNLEHDDCWLMMEMIVLSHAST